MLCSVYKSNKKADTYLYIAKRDDFSKVPAPLMTMFGAPTHVLTFDLSKRKQLGVELDKLLAGLQDQGFYLQLPPPPENLLNQHKAEIGFKDV